MSGTLSDEEIVEEVHKRGFDDEEESLADKLNDLLSDSGSDADETLEDPSQMSGDEDLDEEEFELDDDGCVRDFTLIADALEQTKTGNKTFSDLELREIERKNSILMNKILSHNRRPSQHTVSKGFAKVSSSSINRKRQQEQIDRENVIYAWLIYIFVYWKYANQTFQRLLKKIQSVKPFGLSKTKK